MYLLDTYSTTQKMWEQLGGQMDIPQKREQQSNTSAEQPSNKTILEMKSFEARVQREKLRI